MYADASSFVLTLHVYPDGAVVATSSDEARLKACSSHLLKPHGFKFVQEGRSYSSGRYEHPTGGRRVVEQIRAMSVKDGFTLKIEDKCGKELRKKSLAEILDADDLLADSDVTSASSAAPLSPARAPIVNGAGCPPTQSRKTPASAEPAEGSTPEKRVRADDARPGFRPRALTASFDQSVYATAPAPSPGPASAPAPAVATRAADDSWFASEDALCAALDASAGGAASSTRPQPGADAPAPAVAAAGSDLFLPDDDLCAAMEAHEAAMAAAAAAPAPPAAAPANAPPSVAAAAAATAALPQPSESPPRLARAPGKPACRYGLACYRRNPEHWSGFDHPDDHPFLRECKQSSSKEPTTID